MGTKLMGLTISTKRKFVSYILIYNLSKKNSNLVWSIYYSVHPTFVEHDIRDFVQCKFYQEFHPDFTFEGVNPTFFRNERRQSCSVLHDLQASTEFAK